MLIKSKLIPHRHGGGKRRNLKCEECLKLMCDPEFLESLGRSVTLPIPFMPTFIPLLTCVRWLKNKMSKMTNIC